MISDSFSGSDKTPTKETAQVSITIKNPEKAKEVFDKLKEKETVTMP